MHFEAAQHTPPSRGLARRNVNALLAEPTVRRRMTGLCRHGDDGGRADARRGCAAIAALEEVLLVRDVGALLHAPAVRRHLTPEPTRSRRRRRRCNRGCAALAAPEEALLVRLVDALHTEPAVRRRRTRPCRAEPSAEAQMHIEAALRSPPSRRPHSSATSTHWSPNTQSAGV